MTTRTMTTAALAGMIVDDVQQASPRLSGLLGSFSNTARPNTKLIALRGILESDSGVACAQGFIDHYTTQLKEGTTVEGDSTQLRAQLLGAVHRRLHIIASVRGFDHDEGRRTSDLRAHDRVFSDSPARHLGRW